MDGNKDSAFAVFGRENLGLDNTASHPQSQQRCCEIVPALPSDFVKRIYRDKHKRFLPPIGHRQYQQK